MRQTIKVSGIDGVALTKLDVLDELDEIKMCVAYDLDGKRLDYLPAAVEDQICLLYTSPSPRDLSTSRMPSSA